MLYTAPRREKSWWLIMPFTGTLCKRLESVAVLTGCVPTPAQTGRAYGWWQIFLMAFTNTLREGLESVVFLTGVTAGVDPRSIPIAGIVGIILGIAVGVLLYYTCARMPPCREHCFKPSAVELCTRHIHCCHRQHPPHYGCAT